MSNHESLMVQVGAAKNIGRRALPDYEGKHKGSGKSARCRESEIRLRVSAAILAQKMLGKVCERHADDCMRNVVKSVAAVDNGRTRTPVKGGFGRGVGGG